MDEVDYALKSWGLIVNTVEELERKVLDAVLRFFPRLYTLGAIGSLLAHQTGSSAGGKTMPSMLLGFWQDDDGCIGWLDSQERGSVIYVSFGSLTVMTAAAPSWVISPVLLKGGIAALPREFLERTQGRSFVTSWCDQGCVLAHPALTGFLSHGGWNSMLESVACDVPMLCSALLAEQYTNCRYACDQWGFGAKVEQEVRREFTEGERGRPMRKNAMKWKDIAERATKRGGSSNETLTR